MSEDNVAILENPTVSTQEQSLDRFPFSETPEFNLGVVYYGRLKGFSNESPDTFKPRDYAELTRADYKYHQDQVSKLKQELSSEETDRSLNEGKTLRLQESQSKVDMFPKKMHGFAKAALEAGDLETTLLALESVNGLNNSFLRTEILKEAQKQNVDIQELYKKLGIDKRREKKNGLPSVMS